MVPSLTRQDFSGAAISKTRLADLELIHQGKVRDSYAIDEERMLIIATDRLSAFDVVLPDPIPGKGVILTQISNFWFDYLADVVPNHLTGREPSEFLSRAEDLAQCIGRGVVVQRLRPLPIEAVVRGYLIGSGWKDYCATGTVCGISLPDGLRQAERLPEPIFTPATKAAAGEHDENIDFDAVCELIGEQRANEVRRISLDIYARAVGYAAGRGILIADTKFEFGLDADDRIVLMDEVLTPDSSRFWPADEYRTGTSPSSYDKQFVRDYLESLDWNKRPPGPRLPPEIIEKTRERYEEARRRLTDP